MTREKSETPRRQIITQFSGSQLKELYSQVRDLVSEAMKLGAQTREEIQAHIERRIEDRRQTKRLFYSIHVMDVLAERKYPLEDIKKVLVWGFPGDQSKDSFEATIEIQRISTLDARRELRIRADPMARYLRTSSRK